MRTTSLFYGVCVAAGLFFSAGPAAADIPAPGLCGADEVGEVCDEAVDESGNELGKPGVCVADECSRATPDGPMKYDCVMCRLKPSEGGAGGAGGDPVEPSAGASNQPAKPSEGGTGPAPAKPTAGSGGSAEPAKGGSAATAGKASKEDSADDESGCSMGSGSRRTGVASVASLLALALVLGRRRLQRRA